MTYHRCRASLPLLMCACSLLEAHPSRATSSGASLDTICNSSSRQMDRVFQAQRSGNVVLLSTNSFIKMYDSVTCAPDQAPLRLVERKGLSPSIAVLLRTVNCLNSYWITGLLDDGRNNGVKDCNTAQTYQSEDGLWCVGDS